MITDRAAFLRRLFSLAIDSVSAERCLPAHLPPPPRGRLVVIGAGKAAAAMAGVVERHYEDQDLTGVVIVPDGYDCPAGAGPRRIIVRTASHPLPDERGVAATGEILRMTEGLAPEDMVLCLISGGGSALLVRPLDGLSLADKKRITAGLLRTGAPIADINAVRRRLSAVKGGRLAAHIAPARLLSLIVSDVAGDRPGDIASGPTVPAPANDDDARAILQRYGIVPGEQVLRVLERPRAGNPNPGDAAWQVVASGRTALEAVCRELAKASVAAISLGDDVAGDAADLAAAHYGLIGGLQRARPGPVALVSGGEATVDATASSGAGGPNMEGAGGPDMEGAGGPNMEYVLALLALSRGTPGLAALAADSDGRDGSTDAAGAILTPATRDAARQAGADPDRALRDHDSLGFFQAAGGLLLSGPTHTNVNDIRILLADGMAVGEGTTGGRLVLVVGPSGGGKDSLLAGAREQLAGDGRLVFAKRYITRPATAADAEVWWPLSPAAFGALEENGAFLFSWRAHGFAYGLAGGLWRDLAAGRTVIANVSRAIVGTARQQFGDRLSVIGVSAPDRVLAERLGQRGRENSGQIAARLKRARSHRLDDPGAYEIVNDRTLDVAVDKMLRLLKRLAAS